MAKKIIYYEDALHDDFADTGIRAKEIPADYPFALRGRGFFLCGNHTQTMMDAYTPSLAVFPRHAHIVVGPAAVSLPLPGRVVQLLGAIPCGKTLRRWPSSRPSAGESCSKSSGPA